jgi:hypothetical protein
MGMPCVTAAPKAAAVAAEEADPADFVDGRSARPKRAVDRVRARFGGGAAIRGLTLERQKSLRRADGSCPKWPADHKLRCEDCMSPSSKRGAAIRGAVRHFVGEERTERAEQIRSHRCSSTGG